MALSAAAKEALYLRQLLRELHYLQLESTIIYEDNQSCISMPTTRRFMLDQSILMFGITLFGSVYSLRKSRWYIYLPRICSQIYTPKDYLMFALNVYGVVCR
ncbi:hypothetical protein LIPSTDRAFT_323727 [Lipomyces starkeyi NRRL Y-11557]|uniref:Reverse transcriptase Ty1/copia-type domain-containing protein n=1 Tax=Lipomyces starkeyi NRRL Y-11557 TaxID=675824 RepID=A0A1E3Q1A5_LIPST|nr:hypothetical protein LIPSTDRAFT_323727 [Lipomyces starkeyi NRRL Y-11557]